MKEDGAVVRARAVRELERSVTLSDYDHLRGQPHDPTGTTRGMEDVELKKVREMEQVNRVTDSNLGGSLLHRRSFASLVRHPIAESVVEQWPVTRLTSSYTALTVADA